MDQHLVNVYSCSDGIAIDRMVLPSVFLSPIRIDILKFVHQNMSKNKRQAYSVNQNSGTNSSAKSWGTGRAVARVARVPGSGTHRSGQGAISNMCRGGRIFGPTTIWRKWHHKINKNQRKQALMTAIASSGLVSIVLARGHKIDKVPEIPLVVETSIETHDKTKTGKKILKTFGVYDEILKIKKKKSLRSGKGKMRNRRFRKYKGPLIIFETNAKCFRNLPGIDLCRVSNLNLLLLAPGGHIGRFCIWTYGSFFKLNSLFFPPGAFLEKNKKKTATNNLLENTNLRKIINSFQIQSLVRPSAIVLKKFGKNQN